MISALVNYIYTVMPIHVWLLCCSVAQLCPHGLRPHGLQHARLRCPSLSYLLDFVQTHVPFFF